MINIAPSMISLEVVCVGQFVIAEVSGDTHRSPQIPLLANEIPV